MRLISSRAASRIASTSSCEASNPIAASLSTSVYGPLNGVNGTERSLPTSRGSMQLCSSGSTATSWVMMSIPPQSKALVPVTGWFHAR